jgi:hypothetical protein
MGVNLSSPRWRMPYMGVSVYEYGMLSVQVLTGFPRWRKTLDERKREYWKLSVLAGSSVSRPKGRP